MPNIISIRRQLKTTKSTLQITRAMQMVAASKMRQVQLAALNSRAYFENAWEILKSLRLDKEILDHPLLEYREGNRICFIIFTSDRGLCGGLNNRIIREAVGYLNANRDKQIDVITIGKKGEQALKRYHLGCYASFVEMPDEPTYVELRPLINMTVGRYLRREIDRLIILYAEFKTVLKQEIIFRTLLPIPVTSKGAAVELHDYVFEPTKSEIIDKIVPYLVGNQIYEALLESIASEYSARMVSMKSATENAQQMLKELTLLYHRLRQTIITNELNEIVATERN